MPKLTEERMREIIARYYNVEFGYIGDRNSFTNHFLNHPEIKSLFECEYEKDGYRIKSEKTVFETDRKFTSNDQKISVGVWLENDYSFGDGEYQLSISTKDSYITIEDIDIIKECIENDLDSEYVPFETVVEVYIESDGEMEGMHQFNKYFSIRKIVHVELEEILEPTEPPAPVAEYEIFKVQPIAYESNDPVCEYKGDCTVGCYFCKQYCKTNNLQNFAGHEVEGESIKCAHKFNENNKGAE